MSNTLLRVNQVSKHFPARSEPALKQISLQVAKGQILGLVGPDGAGKTTLIRLITGLMQPTTGNISVAGYDTKTEASQIQQIIGYMPQKFGLYEDLRVDQNLNLYADLRGLPPERQRETFARLLKFTGLDPFTDRLARNLSGGMKQKLGLACALINRPTLLLLDEPSVGVDPISRRELWRMVYDLIDEGISVVWSTSYLDEAEMCHQVVVLNEGTMLFAGPPKKMTATVTGRTFLISDLHGKRRSTLNTLLQNPNIVDGVVQGSGLRILLKQHSSASLNSELKLTPTTPRLEDAFIEMLGGASKAPSRLASHIRPLPSAATPMVKADNLMKKYGHFVAAQNINFSVDRGQIFGLLGPNGAGKTTIFKMMCGLLTPTSGQAYIDKIHLQAAPSKARSQIGYMAQKFSLYGNLSVLQNLQFFAGIYNLVGGEKKQAIAEMIQVFYLETYLNESADSLPLGFKQRLALACAVMHKPPILFLDEPTSGVDPLTRREFWGHMNGMVEKGVTVMVTTHFMDEAEYCDQVALVYKSRIIAMDSPDGLKRMVQNSNFPNPSLEDAFINLIQTHDETMP